MDKFIVTVVPDEASAYAFVSSLQALDVAGQIELYTIEVVTKDEKGRLARKTRDDQRGLGTLVGASVGALLGLLAGPVGAAVGAGAGGAAGFASETAYLGVSAEFLAEVARSIAPGGYAVFVEAYEDWSYPIDEAARTAGGRVLRQPVGDVVTAQIKAENDAGREEMARLDGEIASANEKAKAQLEAERDRAKAQHEENVARAKKRWEELQKTWSAKIASAKEKADKAPSDAKRRHQAIARKLSRFAEEQQASIKELFS